VVWNAITSLNSGLVSVLIACLDILVTIGAYAGADLIELVCRGILLSIEEEGGDPDLIYIGSS